MSARREPGGDPTRIVRLPADFPNKVMWWVLFIPALALLTVFFVSVGYLFGKGPGIWGNNIPVGWGFPIGVGAVVLGLMSLRGRMESRPIAVWGVALGALSLVYSAGWLVYAGIQSGWIG